jgi:hypothetical protein
MRTYYRGPDALVTQERFVWQTASPRVFAVPALENVVLARCDVPAARSGTALPVALILIPLAGASWLLAGPVVGAALAFLAVLAGVAALAVRPRRTVREWQVRATYFGTHVTVYASTDQRVFNQVTRALRRAREDTRPIVARPGLAAA